MAVCCHMCLCFSFCICRRTCVDFFIPDVSTKPMIIYLYTVYAHTCNHLCTRLGVSIELSLVQASSQLACRMMFPQGW